MTMDKLTTLIQIQTRWEKKENRKLLLSTLAQLLVHMLYTPLWSMKIYENEIYWQLYSDPAAMIYYFPFSQTTDELHHWFFPLIFYFFINSPQLNLLNCFCSFYYNFSSFCLPLDLDFFTTTSIISQINYGYCSYVHSSCLDLLKAFLLQIIWQRTY